CFPLTDHAVVTMQGQFQSAAQHGARNQRESRYRKFRNRREHLMPAGSQNEGVTTRSDFAHHRKICTGNEPAICPDKSNSLQLTFPSPIMKVSYGAVKF